MLRIAIDTSTRWAGIAAGSGGASPRQMSWHSRQNHCRELIPNLNALLAEIGARIKDIQLIAVALGPGNFSAVRVGISTAIGLAMPHATPVVGTPTYAVEAEPHWEIARSAGKPLFALLPAGKSEIAWFKLEEDLEHPAASGLAAPGEIAAVAPPGSFACGEAAAMLGEHASQFHILGQQEPSRAPASILRIADRRIASGTQNKFDLRPIYAKQPSISKPRVDYPSQ